MKAISPFVICLFLFMYIFTLMGMQFFAGQIKFNENDVPDSNGESPRYNFNNFLNAFLSVFIIMTGENWNEMMYDTMRATSEISAVYFTTVLILGNIIMLQLLVAIVISNFDESHKSTEKRRIIDSIEAKIELGRTVDQAIHAILGHVIYVNSNDEEGDEIKVKVGSNKLTLYSKKRSEVPTPTAVKKVRDMAGNINKTGKGMKYLIEAGVEVNKVMKDPKNKSSTYSQRRAKKDELDKI